MNLLEILYPCSLKEKYGQSFVFPSGSQDCPYFCSHVTQNQLKLAVGWHHRRLQALEGSWQFQNPSGAWSAACLASVCHWEPEPASQASLLPSPALQWVLEEQSRGSSDWRFLLSVNQELSDHQSCHCSVLRVRVSGGQLQHQIDTAAGRWVCMFILFFFLCSLILLSHCLQGDNIITFLWTTQPNFPM